MRVRLIRGSDLNPKQRAHVLAVFVHRHVNGGPYSNDDQWLAGHAFYFVADGTRLNRKYRHCEPEFMAR